MCTSHINFISLHRHLDEVGTTTMSKGGEATCPVSPLVIVGNQDSNLGSLTLPLPKRVGRGCTGLGGEVQGIKSLSACSLAVQSYCNC